MPWWGWLILGVSLLGVEMFVIDAQFYLVFLGASAVLVGLLGLGGLDLPVWTQWLVFAGLSIITMLAFRKRIYKKIRGTSGHVQQRLTLGDRVVVPVRLEAGQTCRIEYRGSSWTARNAGPGVIAAGNAGLIQEIEDLTLVIRPADAG